MRAIGRPFLTIAAVLLGLAAMSPAAAAAANRYDVSYFWSRSPAGVQDYRDRVAGVLGPGVTDRLKVVAEGDLFGLVYARHGDRAGATRVAKVHTRLLESRGLEAAMPVRSRDWAVLDNGDARQAPFASAIVPRVSRNRTTETERIREFRDLQVAVEEYIRRLRREGKIKDDERTAWSVYDFTADEKLVSINEDEPFEAASMVKLFITAAFFCKVEKGELIYGKNSRRHMELAIQHSNNAATNWMLRKIGGPKAAERVLKRKYPGIFQDTRIVEYIPRGGRTYRNKASAHDYSRFLHAVWNEDISGAREIKRLMGLPSPNRIRTGIQGIPAGTRVYNKTGSTARVCGDVGILNVKGPDGKRYPYTVIGIIEKKRRARDYTTWIRSRGAVIRNVSGIIYRGIVKRYDFY
ncbi:MAG: class A beta-lactamase-related serine hydrolase [Deltaproteobacteria bacterium]|uniref:serine hydrolase n=1 Tax=Candidatus Deferrimicrobium sp. TaxID=3060586 RepID=UPI0027170FBC|nr:serine hydrolase [Candidatus Deferrimicrobium sp.]MCR4310145.1 class A beta-lactamase-related serine hydrolase [Deltaproteobacteria bacterium]MDO8738659.1 serine hydrolase [Candidatus Deferrimicrobium sp.]